MIAIKGDLGEFTSLFTPIDPSKCIWGGQPGWHRDFPCWSPAPLWVKSAGRLCSKLWGTGMGRTSPSKNGHWTIRNRGFDQLLTRFFTDLCCFLVLHLHHHVKNVYRWKMCLSNIQPCAYLGLLVICLDPLKSGHSWAVNNFASQVEQRNGSGPNDPTVGLLYPAHSFPSI